MNTFRVCAVIGFGLSLAWATGCSSKSSSGSKDAGRDTGRDTPYNTNTSTNTSTSTACTHNGVTYQPGGSFTENCVRWTCVSGDNFTGSGSPCSDAALPDLRPGPDLAASPDARPAEVAPPADTGGRDVSVSDTGPRDSTPPIDGGKPDVTVPGDTAPPTPDLANRPDELAICTHDSTVYHAGDQYQPDSCNTCVCLASGDFACTSKVCEVDAGEGID